MKLDEFNITVTVEHDYKVYIEKRSIENASECWHYENIPSIVNYMAKDILKQIKGKGRMNG